MSEENNQETVENTEVENTEEQEAAQAIARASARLSKVVFTALSELSEDELVRSFENTEDVLLPVVQKAMNHLDEDAVKVDEVTFISEFPSKLLSPVSRSIATEVQRRLIKVHEQSFGKEITEVTYSDVLEKLRSN